MKHIYLFLVALLTVGVISAQVTSIDSSIAEANLKASSKKMGELFLDKNYTEYLTYINPKLIQMAGGRDKMIDLLKKSIKQTEDEGFTIQNVAIGEPTEIIKTAKELQAVVPQILVLKTKKGRLEATSYLIATSADKGKTWYYLDTGGKTLAQMKTSFPSLSNALIIPAKKAPLIYND